jgi:predicted nucleotidyltransferase
MHCEDRAFQDYVADVLFGLANIEAVALGGSRSYGNPGPESDWDFSVYYSNAFDPGELRKVGWPGDVSDIGAWGDGVFNGGAWLTVAGRRVDVHYRDLSEIERIQREAFDGAFQIEPLLFHLAGIPSYLLLAEIAEGVCLRGELPKPVYPPALRERASRQWWSRAELLFDYAKAGHAERGRVLQAIGMVAEAVTCAAHAVLAANGTWVTNEKRILAWAGLDHVDDIICSESLLDRAGITALVVRAREACDEAYRRTEGR